MTWLNNDGLWIKYGPSEVAVNRGGEILSDSHFRVTELTLPLTTLTNTSTIVADNLTLPRGALIEAVETVAETAATSGGAATLTVGLIRDDRTTALAATGLINAAALTTINAAGRKTELTQGAAGAGSLVGTRLTQAGLFVANWGTAAFTAGVVKVRVIWYVPSA